MTSPSKQFEFSDVDALKDPIYAAVYLEDCLADGDVELFQAALRDVAKAQGGMTAIAEQTSLSRESLYRALSKEGNPRFDTLTKVLGAAGLRFSITPLTSTQNAIA